MLSEFPKRLKSDARNCLRWEVETDHDSAISDRYVGAATRVTRDGYEQVGNAPEQRVKVYRHGESRSVAAQ